MISAQYLEWMKQMLANAQERKYDYLIACGKDSKQYFYYDFNYVGGVNENVFQLVWTPYQRQGFLFESEQEVEEFKSEYISPRKASIIRVVKTPQSLIELMG